MSAKVFFLTGLLGIGGYVGYTATSYDPAVVPYSKAEVQGILAGAKTTLPRRDGDGHINIWGIGRTAQGVSLAMKYDEADWAPELNCQAVITELGPHQSRVVADCGNTDTGSAQANTQVALQAPMFDEFIQSKLAHRPFDRARASSKEMAVVMKNMGGMQKEALKMSDQASGMSAGSHSGWDSGSSSSSSSSASQSSGGWASDTPGNAGR